MAENVGHMVLGGIAMGIWLWIIYEAFGNDPGFALRFIVWGLGGVSLGVALALARRESPGVRSMIFVALGAACAVLCLAAFDHFQIWGALLTAAGSMLIAAGLPILERPPQSHAVSAPAHQE